MIESRPDWCLSRQRAWGLPIPAFQDGDGNILMTSSVVRAIANVIAEEGSDAWFTKEPSELLKDWENPDGIDLASLTKLHDIFDVWFESGTSWHAVMQQRGLGFPSKLYCEGGDQHRGWFQLSMLPALAVTGHAPFNDLITHGFMVAKDGKKMSKSGGNALHVDDLLKEYGADVCRWWVCSLAYDNDIKVDMSYFDIAAESYRKIRNTLRFLLGNIGEECSCTPDPSSIDAWVLAELTKTSKTVQEAIQTYEFRSVHQTIYDFCNHTLSSIYLAAVKDRLYCDGETSDRRKQTEATIRIIADTLIRLLAPFIPHTADEAWRALHGDESQSVHLMEFNSPSYTCDERWADVMSVRDVALKQLEEAKQGGLENPLDAGLTLPAQCADFDSTDLADLCGVSRVSCSDEEVLVHDLRKEPRCDRSWKRDSTVIQRSDGGMLSDRDANAVGVE
jgi:isoleucyl-tRNA synthetase